VHDSLASLEETAAVKTRTKLIEIALPLDAINKASAREKSIRHGHPSAIDRERERDKVGYDVESRVPGTGRLRFIEVKGRAAGADTATVTKNDIPTSLNKPEDFLLAIVEFHDDGTHRTRYLRRRFQREPDFGVTSVNYDLGELLARATAPE
jgi:hypothetical protein